jgi:hypothetical protein
MTKPLFTQNVIAIVWDFDRTLIPGHMQEPLFEHYEIDGAAFFREANRLAGLYKQNEVLASDTQYLNHLLTLAGEGRLPNFSNELLRRLGAKLAFFPGTLRFFKGIRDDVAGHDVFGRHGIRIEHYIVSTGLRQMILGSAIADQVEHVFGCEFVERVPRSGFDGLPNAQVAFENRMAISYVIDDTSKTRALFDINKGTVQEPRLHVNDLIPESERRVPFVNIIYVADGPSDVPVYSLVKEKGGRTFGVYEERNRKLFDDVERLREDGRIEAHAPANYTEGSQAYLWLTRAVETIAERIVDEHESRIARVSKPPGHVIDQRPSTPKPEFRVPAAARRGLADELLKRAGITAAPVPLEPILRMLNIELTERRSQVEDAILTAMSLPDEEETPSAWLISMSSTKQGVRQRYTIAHEIGHVVLHGCDGLTKARADATRSRPQEREAQAFASDMLMPEFLLIPAVQERGADAATLAKMFQVSKQAMEIRLRELRIVPSLTDA